jgi:hypothetical protein
MAPKLFDSLFPDEIKSPVKQPQLLVAQDLIASVLALK